MVRYCVRCGRLEDKDNPLINSMCPRCYLESKGVFKRTPILDIVLCSKCGQLRFRGRWTRVSGLEDAIKLVLEGSFKKYVNDEVTGLLVGTVSNVRRVNKDYYSAFVEVRAVLEDKAVVDSSYTIHFRLTKMVCPNCFKKAGKTFNAIVQVRSERGYLTDEEIDYIYDIVSDPVISDDIVEIDENRNGIDIKVINVVVAKRIASIITRDKGAKIIETFKLRRYDPSQGRKLGIITISVRLPSINKGELVMYKGELMKIREWSGSGLILESMDGRSIRVRMEEYWGGAVRRPDHVMVKDYIVLSYDHSTIYLLDEETGEIMEFPRQTNLYSLREGDRVRSYRVGDKVYLTKVEG